MIGLGRQGGTASFEPVPPGTGSFILGELVELMMGSQQGMRNGIRPVRFAGERLVLLDQRHLPAREVDLVIGDAREAAAAIADLAVRGAPAIGLTGAYGVVLAAQAGERRGLANTEWLAYVQEAAAQLERARPTAVNLSWAVKRVLQVAERGGRSGELLAEAEAIAAEDLAANRAIGEHGSRLLPVEARVLTHCNAGALATSGYGTALGVVRSAWARGRLTRVYANETRPVLQGARLTVWELMRDSIPVTLIADSAAAWLMAQGEVDAVIVGADRIAGNGDVANKIGTYGLAVVAARHQIPFYVAAGRSTLDPDTPDGTRIVVEERAAAEVTDIGGVRLAPSGTSVRNPAFDVTPAELVTAIVTEVGVLTAPYGPAIAGAMAH